MYMFFFAQTKFFRIFTLTLTLIAIPFLIGITFFNIKLNSHLHDICSVNVFDSFIPVIIFKTCMFKSVSFGTPTLLDKSSRVLPLPAHLSRLTRNG